MSGQYVYVSNGCVSDDSHSIVVFTIEGDYVTSFGQYCSKKGQFKQSRG